MATDSARNFHYNRRSEIYVAGAPDDGGADNVEEQASLPLGRAGSLRDNIATRRQEVSSRANNRERAIFPRAWQSPSLS